MSKRSWQSHYFSLTASSADGKDTACVRHYSYKYNDGATRWELQRLIIGYLNDSRDRAWRPCQVIKENKLIWEVFCLALGLDLRSMVEKSLAMVRATRVDNVFDMLCPNQKTRDVLTISTLGLLIVQICWTILKKKKRWTNGAGGSYSMHSSRRGCLVGGALTKCPGTGERCVHFETSVTSFLLWSCAYLAFWKLLARCIWSRRSSMTTS